MNDLISAGDKALLTKNKTFIIPNFAEEAEMLEWAGVSFGEENTLRLQKSIKVRLLDNNPILQQTMMTLTILHFTEIGNHERR